jgi:hypothetical protein
MGMSLDLTRGARLQQLPRFAEVHHHHVAVVEVKEDALAASIDFLELRTVEKRLELLAASVLGDHFHRVAVVLDLDVFDAPTDDLALEIAPEHLDLN